MIGFLRMPSKKTQAMTDVLAIAYSFPPLQEAVAILNAKMIGQIHELGFRSHVLTVDPTTSHSSADETLNCLLPEDTHIYRFKSRANALYYRGARKMLPVLARLPDFFIWDRRRALALAEQILRQSSIRLLYSLVKPYSCSLVGLALKQRTHLPWVVWFSATWVDNPHEAYKSIVRRVNTRFERSVIEHADAVILTSNETRDLMMEKYPPEWMRKVHVIQSSFRQDLYPALSDRSDSTLIFRYIGAIYPPRTPAPLLQAISLLRSRMPDLIRTCRFECVGTLRVPVDRLKKKYGIDDEIVFKAPVNYLDSLKLMKTADVLMVIDAPEEINVFLPTKLIDYVGAERPILGITPLKGTSARLIRDLGGTVVSPEDPEAIAGAIADIASRYRGEASNQYHHPQDVLESFSIDYATQCLSEVFQDVLSK